MHNKLYDKITILTKFFITLFVCLMLIITKSTYIILFVTLLTVYLILLNSDYLKRYFKILKNYLIPILLLLIIMVLILGLKFIVIYKYTIIILFINSLTLHMSFENTHLLIYKLIRSKYISYKITLWLYQFNAIFMSKDEMIDFQKERGKKRYGIKHRLLARIEYAKYKKNKLDNNLKTNFYTIKEERINFLSVVLFILFAYLLVMVIIRK